MKNIKNWFNGLTTASKVTLVSVVAVLSLGTIGAMAQPGQASNQPTPTPATQASKSQSKLETKTLTTTEAISYTSSTIEDPNLAQGLTEIRTTGVNGVRTRTFEVTYTDGTETARKETKNIITTEPVNEVIAKGTKVPSPPIVQAQPSQPSCPNGTYVNTYGNTVCSPYESSGVPADASAQCSDGTYSFSQSRRGTCSGHGGVAKWL